MVAFLIAALALLAFYFVGSVFLDGFVVDLGSLNFPTPRYVVIAAFWMLFGGIASALLALAMAQRWGAADRLDEIAARWNDVSDRAFLIFTCGLAVAIPLAIKAWLLRGAPLADDESAYHFAAALLASGRLWVPSPELKLFFDQNFMINDGRLYPVYFLGWPALLAVGVLVHLPAVVNPLLSALTIPALLRVLRHYVTPAWARAGILLFLLTPFVQLVAATELSHTSCLAALAWSLAMCLRTKEAAAVPRDHAGFGFALALAFCIRPQSTVALALPLVVSWAMAVYRLDAVARRRAVLAFVIPTGTLAVLFLASLWAQNGSPWRVGYARYNQYIAENQFRFTSFRPSELTTVAGFDFTQAREGLARMAAGLFRLNFDLFGWSSSFTMLVLGAPVFPRSTRLVWAMVGSSLGAALFQLDWGIDTFGPLHAFELALPVLVLTVIGASSLSDRIGWMDAVGAAPRWHWRALPPFLLVSLVLCAWLGFVPVRLAGVQQVAEHVNVALNAPERAGVHRAVIFAPLPFAPSCSRVPRHFILFRPVNDPDLRNDILWVNDLGAEENQRLMATLPGRTGYVLRWTSTCTVTLTPLRP